MLFGIRANEKHPPNVNHYFFDVAHQTVVRLSTNIFKLFFLPFHDVTPSPLTSRLKKDGLWLLNTLNKANQHTLPPAVPTGAGERG